MLELTISSIKGLKGKYKLNVGQIINSIDIAEDRLIVYSRQGAKEIYISKQKTGYGKKSFFKCPNCGERRIKLYTDKRNIDFKCRSCMDKNVYKTRCNLYDGGGTDLIEYKFYKILDKLDKENSTTDKHIPFDYRFYWSCRPKYMRYERFELILKQLTALEGMRMTNILQKRTYNTKEINRILTSKKLKELDIKAITDFIWFNKI